MRFCRETQRLLDDYGDATKDFSQRGRALAAAAISYEADIFQLLWDRCETARQRCSAIRRQITAHVKEHGCELDVFGSDRVYK